MKIVMFYHSLVSDWNHGNAHFLRRVAMEFIKRADAVRSGGDDGLPHVAQRALRGLCGLERKSGRRRPTRVITVVPDRPVYKPSAAGNGSRCSVPAASARYAARCGNVQRGLAAELP